MALSQDDIREIRATWEVLAQDAPGLAADFYAELFRTDPALRPMFPAELAGQGRKLGAAIGLVVQHAHDLAPVLGPLGAMGGAPVTDRNTAFAAPAGLASAATGMLVRMRALHVAMVHLKGEIEVDAQATGQAGSGTRIHVPVTAVAFSDGLTIPFAGYSKTVYLPRATGALRLDLPAALWSCAAVPEAVSGSCGSP
ncbi:globin family protein [Mangrovicoccus ximenensis]|uniref:globin domain-containing protein n=1 Tax=Mangrovicoccus ximenensis TaxID=1911570 RepID=UPI000D3C2914|nr:globin domain-containing protein [Mangrovicoccus ximenensis]